MDIVATAPTHCGTTGLNTDAVCLGYLGGQ